MSHEMLETIMAANREFREFIDQEAREEAEVTGTRRALRRLDSINFRLNQVSRHLSQDSQPFAEDPEGEAEVWQYRENLRTLRSILQTLQVSLLAEKSRMDDTRSNLHAADAWANSLRQIS